MKFTTNTKFVTFFIGFFLFSLFFVFEDANSISVNFDVRVSLDKDEYTVGDEPIIEVIDADKNISSYTKESINVEIVTRVSLYTVPVTVDTVKLVETDSNSGIFTGKSMPISEQYLTHSSGTENKFLSVSYTPNPRGQIYSSAYATLVAPPSTDSSTQTTDASKYRESGTFSCPIISNYNEYGTKTHVPSFEYFECTYKHATYGYPVGSIKATYIIDSVGVPPGWCTGKLSDEYYYMQLYSDSHQISMFVSMPFADHDESLSAVKSLLNKLESANIADTCSGYEPPKPDTIKPVLTVPSDITVQATSSDSAVVTFSVSATDNVDKNLSPTCYPPAGTSTFTIGTTTVNCSVSDSAGNKASKSFLITVTGRDTTPPVIYVPTSELKIPRADIPTSGVLIMDVDYSKDVFVIDNVDGRFTPTCVPSSPAGILIGTTVKITCNAKDKAGNSAVEKSFDIFVDDVIPAKLDFQYTPPRWNAGVKGMDVTFSAIATDNITDSYNMAIYCDSSTIEGQGPITFKNINADSPDGTIFFTFWLERGQVAQIHCSTSDLSFNRSDSKFTITSPPLFDKIPPVVTVPNDMLVSGDGTFSFDADLAWVNFFVYAIDETDFDPPTTECKWTGKRVDAQGEHLITVPQSVSSGSTFIGPGGVMNITCTAKDKAGNIGEASFTVIHIHKADTDKDIKQQKVDATYHVTGDVEIKRASGGTPEKLTKYSTLYPGDSIITGANEKVTIVFTSGDEISIGPKSEFKYEDGSRDFSFKILIGKILAIFDKNSCNADSCYVRTPIAVASVRGTEFVTTHIEGITVFDLKEGTLQITNLSDGEIILVNSGNTVTVDSFATYVKPLTDERWNILTDESAPTLTINEKTQLEEQEPVLQPEGNNDVDGDGITNLDDDCPNIPGSISNSGCPTTQGGLGDVPYGDESPEGYVDEPFHGNTRVYDDEYDDDYDFYEYEDPENIVYDLYDLRYYNIGLEIPKHWKVWASINKADFPDRTFYSFWYNSWMNWLALGLYHDIGQQINLQSFDEVSQYIENFERQWCLDTLENPFYLDDPGEEGWMTCLEIKDFRFKKVIVDGRDAYQVSYQLYEKFRFERGNDVEHEYWHRWLNLIPYGDDLIIVGGETIRQNVGSQKSIILDFGNSLKILNDGSPIFDETTSPILSSMTSERELSPTVSKIIIPTPTLEIISTPNEKVSDLISLKLDESQVILKRHEPVQLKISGEVENYVRGTRVTFSITDPEGITTEQRVIATKDGYFENYLGFDFRVHNHGEYKIQAQYLGEKSQIVSLKLKSPFEEIIKDVPRVKEKVPEWIKENIRLWADGAIGDDSFKQGISFMIKEDIITIDDLPKSSDVSEDKIPSWVKNNAKWWADGAIDESEFVNGLKYMIEKGIISVN